MSVSAASVAKRFEKTSGEDPIFRLNDGANSPLADVSTREQRRQAYSMLRTKGVIRVGLPVPANAEFILAAVADPYGYAGNNANGNELSLFRRPAPDDEPRVPQHGHVGRARDIAEGIGGGDRLQPGCTSPMPRRRAMPRRSRRSTRRRAS